MPARGRLTGYDMTIDETIGLNLYRDSKQAPVQAGRFSQSEAMRAGQGLDQPVIFDRLDGGLGAIERLIPNTYALGINACTRFGRSWLPSGEIVTMGALPSGSGGRVPGEIHAFAEDGNDILIAAGGVLLRTTSPYTAFTVELTVNPTEEIRDVTIYNGIPIVGTFHPADGTPGQLWVYHTGAWHNSTSANREHFEVTYFTITGSGAYRLISNDTQFSFKFIATTDPLVLLNDATWSSDAGAGYQVGDRVHPITNLVGAPLVMYFIKTDGVYHLQEDGRSARIADWSDSIHPRNGKAAIFAYGGIYASHGRWGLVRVDVANLQVQWQTNACAPGSGMPRVSPINGQITDLAMDGEWIVALVWNGTDTYTCYGRPNETTQQVEMIAIKSPQTLNWHGSEATYFSQKGTAILQASVGATNRPLLWTGLLTGGTPSLAQVSLPDNATPLEDLINGGPHRFATESWLYLPREDWGDDNGAGWASVRKIFTRLDLNAEGISRDVTWIDAYMATQSGHDIFWDRALDDTSLWNFVGRIDDSDRISLVPGAVVQSGIKASMMFRGFGDRVAPFSFYAAKLRAIPMMEQQERRRYRVMVGPVRSANKSRDRRNRAAILNRLWALQWADPVTLDDHAGVRLIVKVEEGMSYDEFYDQQTKDWVTSVTFTIRILRRPFYWGTGFRWGTDVIWS